MASIVPNAWRLTSKTVLATERSAVKKAREKKKNERWARRMLHWQPSGRGPLGRPAMNWTTKFEQGSRMKHWRDWKEVAADADRWMMESDKFIKFCTQ